MRKKLVYICSTCRGDIEKNIEKAQRYCREAVELRDDVIPIAPHVYFTQFLDDTKQEERAAGMDMGLFWPCVTSSGFTVSRIRARA